MTVIVLKRHINASGNALLFRVIALRGIPSYWCWLAPFQRGRLTGIKPNTRCGTKNIQMAVCSIVWMTVIKHQIIKRFPSELKGRCHIVKQRTWQRSLVPRTPCRVPPWKHYRTTLPGLNSRLIRGLSIHHTSRMCACRVTSARTVRNREVIHGPNRFWSIHQRFRCAVILTPGPDIHIAPSQSHRG